MIRNGKKRGVLQKYLISYLLILAIPLIIMSFFLYTNAANALKNEMESYTLNRMRRISEVFDGKIKETFRIAVKISYNDMFRPTYIEETGHNIIMVKEQLTGYRDDAFLNELFLYLDKSEYLFTGNGIIKPNIVPPFVKTNIFSRLS